MLSVVDAFPPAAVCSTELLGRQTIALQVARAAIISLHDELILDPKPGLVTPTSNGSHGDMTAATFMRSLFALRHYFERIALAGIDHANFAELRMLGINAERTMMAATGGINTHRGAIFALGMLCAATGAARMQQTDCETVTTDTLRRTLLQHWGGALRSHVFASSGASYGRHVSAIHAARGARGQAAAGFPAVFDIGLPRLHATLAAGGDWASACVDTLFALMAEVSDTNVVHRGGPQGAGLVRRRALAFLQAGGSADPDWRQRALQINCEFVRFNLSPGGAADLLAATCLAHRVSVT